MTKSAAQREIDAMAHLASEVDRCRPIDRQRVAELVRAGVEMERDLGSQAANRVNAWLTVRAKVDTDEALHTAELRRQAREAEKGGAPVPEPAPDPESDPEPATGHDGLPLADCVEPGHVGCTRDGDSGEVVHRLAAAGA